MRQRMQRNLRISLILISLYLPAGLLAQHSRHSIFNDSLVRPRMRVIIDNDFSGDPDGLFQLAHQLLSPTVEIRGIIGSHLPAGDGFTRQENVTAEAVKRVQEVLDIMELQDIPVYQGSNEALDSTGQPYETEAVKAIIAEAMRDDSSLPLFLVCGAGLTEPASALLLQPAIAERMTIIWIGGPEYPELATPPPGYSSVEYNLGIDRRAAQVVFNQSKVPIWQVPRNAYRQAIFPYSSMLLHVKTQGKIGEYLTHAIERIMEMSKNWNLNLGETYIIGDSPLVLLTALQSNFEADPSSSEYVWRPAPRINDQGLYEVNHAGRNIRVYTRLDIPLMVNDFLDKLRLYNLINSESMKAKPRKKG